MKKHAILAVLVAGALSLPVMAQQTGSTSDQSASSQPAQTTSSRFH